MGTPDFYLWGWNDGVTWFYVMSFRLQSRNIFVKMFRKKNSFLSSLKIPFFGHLGDIGAINLMF